MAIENITFEAGFMVLTREHNRQTRYPIADVLRALDIPTGLTFSQVGAITSLANMFVVLLRTLIHKGVLNEDFLEDGGYNITILQQSIEDMGGDYTEPNVTVT